MTSDVLFGDYDCTVSISSHLLAMSDWVWERTSARLRGLSDEEYLWEPVPGCWTVRPHDPDRGGPWRMDGPEPAPSPPPFTTIAWRLEHTADLYAADLTRRLLRPGAPAEPPPIDGGVPPTAAAGIDRISRAHDRWRSHLAAADEEVFDRALPEDAPHWANGTGMAYVLVMLDEFAHHGAEVALLRDLFAATRAPRSTGSELLDRLVAGGTESDEAWSQLRDDGSARNEALLANPDAVERAAHHGRWDLVVRLARLGFDPNGSGLTPLHRAVFANAIEAAEALVEHGADLTACDPQFSATPLGWAEHFQRTELTKVLALVTPKE